MREMPQQQDVSVSGALAHLVATSSWQDVAAQSHQAKRSILNFFATALGSSNDPAVTSALQVLAPFSGSHTSSVIGRSERLDALGAGFVNAISAGHYARGWHITSTCGVFGAAAACAKLLGLAEDGVANAIGIAASQSAGIVENLSSAAKNVSVGNAARNGLFSALLSEGGYAASARAIEGPLGWARAMGDQPDLEVLLGGLGKSWEIAKNTYKPYPAGIVFHAVIDACFKLRAQLEGAVDNIVSVTVQGSPLLLARGDRPVITERDARVSIHHSVACVLLCGAAGVREFSAAVVFQPEIVRLREKVTAELDTSLPDGAASVSIRTRSGKILSEEIMSARGSLANPLSDGDIETKLRDCARSGEAKCDPERLIEAVWRLETLPDIAPLVNSSSGRPS